MNHEQSVAAFSRAKKIFPGGVNSPVRSFSGVGGTPFVVERGEGAYLVDVDSNRYVDYICSWGPLVLGHAHPAVVDAIARQAALGTSYGACARVECELAEFVKTLVPSMEMLRFVNSGTEAGMSVLRLARGFTGRAKILKFSGCYHGHADALLVDAGSGVATLGIPSCQGVLASTTQDTLTAQFNNLDSVKQLFAINPATIAAIVVEPVMGNAGLIVPERGFLEGLREIATREGALLIFDEVMTGFRVDLGGAQALYGVTPDLTMLGKVIGGGLPVGAFGGRKDIMEQLAPLGKVYQAGTLSGNPLAMRAGLTTLQLWSEKEVFNRAAQVAATVARCLLDEARWCGIPLISQSVGTMFGFFFHPGPVTSYEDAKGADVARFKKFFHAALEAGVYFAPSSFEAGFVSLAHEGAPCDYTCDTIRKVMRAL